MAVRLVPFYNQIIEYTQAQEDTLASTLTGHPAGEAMIFNTTLNKVRVWDGTVFVGAPDILPSDLTLATSTQKGALPATGTPSGKYLKDDLTWATAGGGTFNGTLDDITTGSTNVHLTTTLKSTYDAKVETNDARLSDARTPLTHNHTGVYAPVLGADDNYVTDAQKVVIGNTSNTNSGDNAANTQYSGLAASKENTGVATGLISTHAALQTGVHGLAITAGQTLTVTTGGTLGSAAYTASTAYATAAQANATHTGDVTGTTALTVDVSYAGSKCLTSNFTTSSVTAVSTNLAFAIAASAVYDVDVYGTCSKATSNTGLKFAVNCPASCAIIGTQYGGVALLATPLVPSLITAINTLGTVLATGIGVKVAFHLHFIVVNSTNAGSITIQAATVTSNIATVYARTKMNWCKAVQV